MHTRTIKKLWNLQIELSLAKNGLHRLLTCFFVLQRGNQEWIHDRETGLIRNPNSDTCMELQESRRTIILADCNSALEEQRWKFKKYAEDSSAVSVRKKKRITKEVR